MLAERVLFENIKHTSTTSANEHLTVFQLRQRLLHPARMLSSLRAQGLTPREYQFEASAAHDVARSMARAARHRSVLAASDIHRLARRAVTRRSSPSPDRGGSVASTRLDSSPDSRPSSQSALAALGEDAIPPTFRKVLGEIGADE